jgi:hypothetical protein
MPKKTDVVDVEASVVDLQPKTLFDRVSDYLTSKDWQFTTYEDRQYYSFTLQLRDGNARIFVDPVEGNGWSRILVLTTFSTYVPEQKRRVVAEAIARINYANIFGNFEMDFDDGEVRSKAVLECNGYLGDDLIDRAIRKSLDLADQYQAPLLGIAFGNLSPKDVIEMASRGEEATLQ